MSIYIKDNALCIKVTDIETVRYSNDSFKCLDDLREMQEHLRSTIKEIENKTWLQGKSKREKAMNTKAVKLLIHLKWIEDNHIWEGNHKDRFNKKNLEQLYKKDYAHSSFGSYIVISQDGYKYLEEIELLKLNKEGKL